jgi:CRISPR-associated protein Csd2
MTTTTTLDPANRIDFVYLFDVHDGNPNGDPDAGNAPRMDPETGQGLVSDVSLKRKVRDYVAAAKGDRERYNIYVKLHSALHERREVAYRALDIGDAKKGKDKAQNIERARKWMCDNYFDVRAFGAVMGVTDFNCGQVRGPMQVTFARSIDPIADLEQTIARKAVEKEDAERQLAKDGFITGTLGRKSIVPYALYRCQAFYNPHFARDTGFDTEDLALTIDALRMMFEIDRSATRGRMSAQATCCCRDAIPLERQSPRRPPPC